MSERSATAAVSTRHGDAARVAGAVAPDNTSEMATRAEAGRVVTEIRRGSASGLRATVDDYLVNLLVAQAVTELTVEGEDDP